MVRPRGAFQAEFVAAATTTTDVCDAISWVNNEKSKSTTLIVI